MKPTSDCFLFSHITLWQLLGLHGVLTHGISRSEVQVDGPASVWNMLFLLVEGRAKLPASIQSCQIVPSTHIAVNKADPHF